MRFWDYLADRAVFLATFMCGVSLALLTVWLEQAALGFRISVSTLVYAMVLSAVVGFAALAFDYRRKTPLLHQIGRVLASKGSISDVMLITDPVSRQEKMLTQLLHSTCRRHYDELESFRRREEFRRHLSDRWVHHMKTPVSVIELLVQQGEEITTVEMAKGLFDSIGEENRRLADRLELFLNSVRMDRFEEDLHLESVDILQLTRDVLNSHKKELIRYSIFPKIQCRDREIWVPTDRKWMKFVIEQIVSNAIKYTRIRQPDKRCQVDMTLAGKRHSLIDSCSKALTVSAENKGETCILAIRDQGVGIPPEDIPRIFEPFFTGFNGRLVPESTGMGLYLSRRVISSLGHRIAVNSRSGEGTTVTVTFLLDSVTEGVMDRAANLHNTRMLTKL